MKRDILAFLFTAVLACVSALYPSGRAAAAGVHVGINVMPPPVVFSVAPSVVVIPGTYAYFIPGIKADIFFYQGYWYRPYRGHWYRAHRYDGPWGYIEPRRVPGVVLHISPDFRRVRPGHERITYEHLKKNWRRWEKERYWDRRDNRRGHERRDHRRY